MGVLAGGIDAVVLLICVVLVGRATAVLYEQPAVRPSERMSDWESHATTAVGFPAVMVGITVMGGALTLPGDTLALTLVGAVAVGYPDFLAGSAD